MFRKLLSRDPMLTNRLAEEAPVVVNAMGSGGWGGGEQREGETRSGSGTHLGTASLGG